MKNSIYLALALTVASFSATAGESNLGYSSVEVGYAQQSIHTKSSFVENTPYYTSRTSVDNTHIKGGYINGSWDFERVPLYVFGSYAQGKDAVTQTTSASSTPASPAAFSYLTKDTQHVTAKEFSTGLGYYYGFNPDMNLITELAFVHQRGSARWNDDKSYSFHQNGGRLSVGYDVMLTKKLEGWVKANYINWRNDHAKGDFSGTIGVQYKITPTWGITASGDFADKTNTYKMGVRMSF